jgi:hypothetical protein
VVEALAVHAGPLLAIAATSHRASLAPPFALKRPRLIEAAGERRLARLSAQRFAAAPLTAREQARMRTPPAFSVPP